MDNFPESQRLGHFVSFACASPEDLPRHERILRSRQPAIFCPDQDIHRDATLFLSCNVVLGHRPNTWRTYAYALVSWLDFLLFIVRLPYVAAQQDDLLKYREFYSDVASPYTKKTYSNGTTSLRMTIIIEFYKWLHKQGAYAGDILEGKLARRRGWRRPIDSIMLPHVQSENVRPGSYAIVPKVEQHKPIRPLLPKEVSAFRAAAGPRGSLDRSLADVGIFVGLRVDETDKLNLADFESLDATGDPHKLQYVMILGKGGGNGKLRKVGFPQWLIRDIQTYIAGERMSAVMRAGFSHIPESALFVTGLRSRNPAPGFRISVRAIQDITSRISVTAKLLVPGQPDDDGKEKLVARVSYHDLRHTYAVATLAAYILKNEERDGLQHIQEQLGHAYLQTTVDYYLKEAEIWMAAVGIRNINTVSILGEQH